MTITNTHCQKSKNDITSLTIENIGKYLNVVQKRFVLVYRRDACIIEFKMKQTYQILGCAVKHISGQSITGPKGPQHTTLK